MATPVARFSAAFAVLLLVLIPAAPAHADASAQLAALIQRREADTLRLDPSKGVARGLPESLGHYEDDLTAAGLAERRRLNARERAGLAAIDRAALTRENRLSYDILAWRLSNEARLWAPPLGEDFQMLPLDQFFGRHLAFARELEWHSRYPYDTPEQYRQAIARISGFAHWIDTAIAAMRRGMVHHITQPRIVVTRMIAQLETLRDPVKSDFLGPVTHMPDAIPPDMRPTLRAAYRNAIYHTLEPAYARLLAFLKTDYLPAARVSIGLSAMPDGKAMYRALIRSETTEDLSPGVLHAMGLADMTRIEAQMEKVKNETGFTGSLEEFRAMLRRNPRFSYANPAAMKQRFEAIAATVRRNAPKLFATLPKTPLVFRFTDAIDAPTQALASYTPPSPGGHRPGIVSLNTYDLAERRRFTAEVLELHEGLPGHHLQMALAIENTALPDFRRYGSNPAFAEGWALYAETLGPALGLYETPYDRFGALSFEAWRAARLVMDTGIHWDGWSRARARAYLLAHTLLGPEEAETEVERYIALPAQALAYKVGQREFLSLRAHAQRALGPRFSLRAFHTALLEDGAMPLPVLDAKMTAWIGARLRSAPPPATTAP